MTLHTCAEVISLVRSVEKESAKVYEKLAEKLAAHKDLMLSYAKENAKFVVQTERAYYGVISDAIEGCFAFELEAEKYAVGTEKALKASGASALAEAVKLEEEIVRLYTDATEQSKSLMADVPRTFSLIAKKRADRIAKIKSLQA